MLRKIEKKRERSIRFIFRPISFRDQRCPLEKRYNELFNEHSIIFSLNERGARPRDKKTSAVNGTVERYLTKNR